jgi:hypothetical protein
VSSGGVADLVEAQAGLFGRDREICISVEGARCTTVARIRGAADVSADWKNDREVEIFIVGGTLLECTAAARGGFTVRVRQVRDTPGVHQPIGNHHEAARLFGSVPDTCPAAG